MQFAQFQINTLPLVLSCYENGLVSIERIQKIGTVIDQPEQGIQAIFDDAGATIGTTDISYGELIDLVEMPQVKAWITAQGMQLPNLKGN